MEMRSRERLRGTGGGCARRHLPWTIGVPLRTGGGVRRFRRSVREELRLNIVVRSRSPDWAALDYACFINLDGFERAGSLRADPA